MIEGLRKRVREYDEETENIKKKVNQLEDLSKKRKLAEMTFHLKRLLEPCNWTDYARVTGANYVDGQRVYTVETSSGLRVSRSFRRDFEITQHGRSRFIWDYDGKRIEFSGVRYTPEELKQILEIQSRAEPLVSTLAATCYAQAQMVAKIDRRPADYWIWKFNYLLIMSEWGTRTKLLPKDIRKLIWEKLETNLTK